MIYRARVTVTVCVVVSLLAWHRMAIRMNRRERPLRNGGPIRRIGKVTDILGVPRVLLFGDSAK